MQRPDYIPENYNRIYVADGLDSFFSTSFKNPVNVILLPRKLSGDFNAVARALEKSLLVNDDKGYRIIESHEDLNHYLSGFKGAAGEAAACIQGDFLALQKAGYERVQLRIVTFSDDYKDAQEFHVDGRGHESGRVLCCYTGAATEGLRNEDARCTYKLDGSELYSCPPNVQPFRFSLGDIWRHACEKNLADIPPFIHRAPRTTFDAPRLVLVASKY